MTSYDKKRTEEIRDKWKVIPEGDTSLTVPFLLAQLDEAHRALELILIKCREDDEQAREFGVLEEDKKGYITGIAGKALGEEK